MYDWEMFLREGRMCAFMLVKYELEAIGPGGILVQDKLFYNNLMAFSVCLSRAGL